MKLSFLNANLAQCSPTDVSQITISICVIPAWGCLYWLLQGAVSFKEQPTEIVLALFQGRVMCAQTKFLGTKLLASGNPCEVGQGLWSWRWETPTLPALGGSEMLSYIDFLWVGTRPYPINYQGVQGWGDCWAPILGNLTLIRSSNIPNIGDTAWESVEEEGRGQGDSSLLKLKRMDFALSFCHRQ